MPATNSALIDLPLYVVELEQRTLRVPDDDRRLLPVMIGEPPGPQNDWLGEIHFAILWWWN